MGRMWAAGAAIVLGLALRGVPSVAQSPTAGASEAQTLPGQMALVTGTQQCTNVGGYSETYVNGVTVGRLPDIRCTLDMNDPRVTGPVRASIIGACYPPGSWPDDCVYTVAYELTGPDGSWSGTVIGALDISLRKISYQAILQGTGAYGGWTFVAHLVETPWTGGHVVSGLIYEGPPPPWEPLPSVSPAATPSPVP